jgi:uncharacterized DUF497 family protein
MHRLSNARHIFIRLLGWGPLGDHATQRILIASSYCENTKINYNVVMSNIKFEWDLRKASANEKKHGISFEEARTVFFDENAKLIDDPDHSDDEERFVLLGLSSSLKVVLVCHCYREEGNVIRIISARKASAHESKQYR